MFFVGAVLNAVLFIFNMLPIPMLDGWNVFNFFLPGLNRLSDEVKNGFTFIVIILFFMTPLIDWFFKIGQIMTLGLIGLFGSML